MDRDLELSRRPSNDRHTNAMPSPDEEMVVDDDGINDQDVLISDAIDSYKPKQQRRRELYAVIAVSCAYGCLYVDSGIPEANRCLALLVWVSVMWLTEPIPPHITALAVPFLAVVCQVMRVPEVTSKALIPAKIASSLKPGDPMPASSAASVLAASFYDPVILLFLSGFTMGTTLDRSGLSDRFAQMVLSRAGQDPKIILLSLVLLSVFLSSFLSNVAASVLAIATVTPILKTLPKNSDWPKQSLLGIAYACNIGGMTTPIASPQNVVSLVALRNVTTSADQQLSFFDWCKFALIFCSAATVCCFYAVQYFYKENIPNTIQNIFMSRRMDPMTRWDWFIIATIAVTVFLWCIFDSVSDVFGHIGIVALLPVIIFNALSLVSPKDFQAIPWNVIALMGGGLALGNAVESSGLLTVIASLVTKSLEGQSLWVCAVAFNLFAVIFANFFSHTVCAMIIMPFVASVGVELGHPRLLAVGVAFMISAAMGLPVSSFPNANALGVRTDSGRVYIQSSDFVKSGLPIAGVLFLLQSTLGYAVMRFFDW